MKEEQVGILVKLPEEDMEVMDKLPEGEVLTFSLTPKGDKMEVKVVCSIHVDFAAYESVRDKIMFKILEIKKIVREAEVELDI